MWPKLQLQQEKPHWLRLDFDLMQESSDEGEADDDNREVSQVAACHSWWKSFRKLKFRNLSKIFCIGKSHRNRI